MDMTARQQAILNILRHTKAPLSISHIRTQLHPTPSIPTLNRDLAHLVKTHHLIKTGKARATVYTLSPAHQFFTPIALDDYFNQDPDTRHGATGFNHQLLDQLQSVDLFTQEELRKLEALKATYQANLKTLSPVIYQKELERLTIELSWKSAQIEGNTYSLLETERLLLEQEPAPNKSPQEATMLLNHKETLNYLLAHPTLGENINLRLLEEIHSILIKDLGVSRNIRTRAVGITGTSYQPLDNAYQIKESIETMCELINRKNNVFEKALLAILLVSYIQPFEDGNKRTGRMLSAGLFITGNACPLSYRSIDALTYKKAMLLFYEQNNISAFKQIFIEQNQFSAGHYFR